MTRIIYLIALAAVAPLAAAAETQCFGEGAYQVCTTTTIDANGNMTVSSSDTMGNSYEVNSESYSAGGRDIVRSYDSEGNSYQIESWSDASGVHTRDSEGNTCTITNSGLMIGCD